MAWFIVAGEYDFDMLLILVGPAVTMAARECVVVWLPAFVFIGFAELDRRLSTRSRS